MNVLPSSSGNMLMTLSDGALQCAEKNAEKNTVGNTMGNGSRNGTQKHIKYVKNVKHTHKARSEKRQKNRFSTLQWRKHAKRVWVVLQLQPVPPVTFFRYLMAGARSNIGLKSGRYSFEAKKIQEKA